MSNHHGSSLGGSAILSDLAATARAAAHLAAALELGDIVTLAGPLGAGKTTFVRFLLRALGLTEEIPSPTFNLVLTYSCCLGEVWHFDLYRLDEPSDAYELGIEDAFAEAVSLIEWPERLAELMPGERLDITLDGPAGGELRELQWQAQGSAGARLAKAMAKGLA